MMEAGRRGGLRKMSVGVMMMMVVMLGVGEVGAELVDIKPYYSLILEHHNGLRRNVTPTAADMREMMWDDGLASDAEAWAKYCRYERPPQHMYKSGSNLFYQRKMVHSWHSVRSAVQKGLRSWSRSQNYYRYSIDCGSSCSYVQMIYSSTFRVGCALNTCPSLTVRNSIERHTSLFVCLYEPRGRLMGTYPYRSGPQCSSCPSGTYCSQGLCADGAGVVVSRPQESIRRPPPRKTYQPEVAPPTPTPRPPVMSADKLTRDEKYFLMQVQNRFRKEGGCQELQWDDKLNQWTDWIISCQADYPGPPYTYTNFYRCPDHMPAYEVVYGWSQEGMDTSIQLDKGCRTPYDHTKCNHYTNMMQPLVNKMACSACSCGDGTRQLVCIYENEGERYYRGYA